MIRSVRNIFFCLLVIFSWVQIDRGVPLADAGANHKEVMALYLYNFLLFVDWPEGDCGQRNTLNVSIYGDPLLFKAFAPMSGKLIKGKKLHLSSSETLEDLEIACQVLFVGKGKQSDIPAILKRIHNRCILTLSDVKGFTRKGGMVYLKNPADTSHADVGRKKFEINLSAVKRSCLKIRSRLLRISDIVSDGNAAKP